MSRVDHLNDILTIVRSKVEETGRTRTLSSAQKTASNSRSGRAPRGRVNARELERRILERIKKIPPGEREFTKKAGRIFVDAVMVWEFGEELLLDSEYDELAHCVLTSMLDHDETRRIMEGLFGGSAINPTVR